MASLYIVFIMLLALGMSALNVYARHNLVNAMAHEIARYVEIKGIIDAGTHAEFARLKQASGLTSATVSFDRTGRIPLEAPFTVTVTVKEKFGIGGIQVIPVEVKAVSTGRSEVYWK
jgi:hypothetical protein